jgi:L-fuconolactonase
MDEIDNDALYRGAYPRSQPETRQWLARRPAESALEPDLPIVDAHHHLFGAETDPNYYRIEDLERDLAAGHRIIGTVYMEGYSSGWRTDGPQPLKPVGEVEMIVAKSREPLRIGDRSCRIAAGIVAHADLTLGAAVDAVFDAHEAAGDGRMRGIRHYTVSDDGVVGRFATKMQRPGLLADPDFRKGFARLEPAGLSYDAWTYHHQLGEVIDLVDAFPDTTIILDHVGGVLGVGRDRAQRDDVLACWENDIRDLARRDNVFLKIGGMGMTLFGFGFEHRDVPPDSIELARAWQPLIDVCIDAFGPSRCMFESNFPVDGQSCGYVELWNAFKRASLSLSADERADLFYRTACRVYRLPELERGGDQNVHHLMHLPM